MARRRTPDKDRRTPDKDRGDNSMTRRRTPDKDPVVWSVRVHPGRCVQIRIDRGGEVNIQRVCFTGVREEPAAHDVPPAGVKPYQIFFRRIRDKNAIQLAPLHPTARLVAHFVFKETFCLWHTGFRPVSFEGYQLGPVVTPPLVVNPPLSIPSQVNWPLPPDITTKVMSMLGSTKDVANAEGVCKSFYYAGTLVAPYLNIDLTTALHAEDSTLVDCLRRSHGFVNSLAFGWPLRTAISRKSLLLLASIGSHLTKLRLLNVAFRRADHLRPVFVNCPLTDFEIHDLHSAFPAEKMLELMAEHCRSMKRFVYIDERTTAKRRIAKHSTLSRFVNNCGQIESLTLGGIKIADSDLALILQDFTRLTTLDLSGSIGFIGSFLSNVDAQVPLAILVLRECASISQQGLNNFLIHLLQHDNHYPNFMRIVVPGELQHSESLTLLGQRGNVEIHIADEEATVLWETGHQVVTQAVDGTIAVSLEFDDGAFADPVDNDGERDPADATIAEALKSDDGADHMNK